MGATDRAYFGEPLQNSGAEALEILDIRGSATGHASAEYSIDPEGPSRGQLLGGFIWPTSEPLGAEEAVIRRMVPPRGVIVPAGSTVALILALEPKSKQDDAIVTETVVDYRVGTKEFVERILVQYRAHHGYEC